MAVAVLRIAVAFGYCFVMTPEKYMILSSISMQSLQDSVANAIEDGYDLVGGVSVAVYYNRHGPDEIMFYQAVALRG